MNYQQALAILELPDAPDPADVKRQFRLLALRYHPDRNPNDPKSSEQFRNCSKAYRYLIDHLPEWTIKNPSQKTEPVFANVDDLFDDMFGFTREARVIGIHTVHPLPLTLNELTNGGEKECILPASCRCKKCEGWGATDKRATLCTYCFGLGTIRVENPSENSENNEKYTEKQCSRCTGRGRIIKNICSHCHGFGRVDEKRKVRLQIPVGLKAGQRYTLRGIELGTKEPLDFLITPELIDSKKKAWWRFW